MKKPKLKRWSITATVVGGKHLGVYEAATAEEAIKKGIEKNGWVNLCHQCVGECENAEIENVTAEETDEPEEDEA